MNNLKVGIRATAVFTHVTEEHEHVALIASVHRGATTTVVSWNCQIVDTCYMAIGFMMCCIFLS